MPEPRIGVVGATGAVGSVTLELLAEHVDAEHPGAAHDAERCGRPHGEVADQRGVQRGRDEAPDRVAELAALCRVVSRESQDARGRANRLGGGENRDRRRYLVN